jgi:RNA polymerase sigma-70 factor (ECF subfamily)
VAHNWIVDHFRRSSPDIVALDPDSLAHAESDPDVVVDARLDRERLRLALLKLTSEQRSVLVLRYLEGHSNEETAATLHKSVGAVKALQHRALATLKRLMDEREQRR